MSFDITYLEVDNDQNDDNCGDQVGDIWRVLTVESLLQRVDLVLLGAQEVEESDDGSFELSTLLCADSDGGEGFPEDNLADVGRNEERDTGAETVTLLKELIEQDNDNTGQRELENDQSTIEGTDFVDGTVHA